MLHIIQMASMAIWIWTFWEKCTALRQDLGHSSDRNCAQCPRSGTYCLDITHFRKKMQKRNDRYSYAIRKNKRRI